MVLSHRNPVFVSCVGITGHNKDQVVLEIHNYVIHPIPLIRNSFVDVVTSTPQVMEADCADDSNLDVSTDYVVQYPVTSLDVFDDILPTPPLASEMNLRFDLGYVQK